MLLGGDAQAWQRLCQQRGWQFLDGQSSPAEKSLDQRLNALAHNVEDTVKAQSVDADRVYLAGQAGAASAVFYAASRLPSTWAAAVALGGSPRAAMDSNRLFAANTTNLPVLWVFGNPDEEPLGQKLKSAGFNLQARRAQEVKPAEILDWLGGHTRDPYPSIVDYETGTPLFARCYWVEVTRFDPAERNDVLDSTRVAPLGSGASLDLGSFGYDASAEGPGVPITHLPDKYPGPLKLNDRIVSVGGKEIKDAHQYEQMLYAETEEKPVAIMIERHKDHVRLETKIVHPPRAELVTARVQAQYLPETHEIQVISRAIAQMKITLPADWLPAAINWNGTELATARKPGCWLLDEQKELLTGKPCQSVSDQEAKPTGQP